MPNDNAMLLLQELPNANPKQMKMTTCHIQAKAPSFQIAIWESCMHASDHVKLNGLLFILKLTGSKNSQQIKVN